MATLNSKQRAGMLTQGGLSEDVIAGILGIDLADVQRLMIEANPVVELPGIGATPTWDAIPALQNSWLASGSVVPRYCLDALKYVQCEGEIQAGTTAANTLLFTFPVGFRPTKRYTLPVVGSNGTFVTRQLNVDATGEVRLNIAAGATETFSLAPFRFPTF